jgi:hypothetical protein
VQLRLGINTCFAVKRWPRVADWGPIVRDRLGLQVVEHSLDLVDLTVDDAASFRKEVVDFDLELLSVFTGLAAYSSSLLLHPDDEDRAAAEAWSLDRLAETARLAGIDQLLVENLAAAREPSTMAMIRDLVTDGDDRRVPIRLALDVGHQCVPGTSGAERDPYAWLSTMGGLAAEIQLQQSDAAGDHHWPFTAARNAIGRIDADRTIDALEASGIERCVLVLEVIPAFEQPDEEVLDDLAASVDYWRDALDRRGVLANQA